MRSGLFKVDIDDDMNINFTYKVNFVENAIINIFRYFKLNVAYIMAL